MTAVSVVIPTRDRPETLATCLHAVLAQKTDRVFEVIVVDDGRSHGAVTAPADPRVRIVQGPRQGPAAARNAGIAAADGDVILFTDDDTIAHPQWLEAAAAALDADKYAIGVEGPIDAVFDPLYQHAVFNHTPGALFTCNVGYRREPLTEEHGFDTRFRFAHCEDRDLGLRMLRHGRTLFVQDMRVEHPPRPAGLLDIVRRGRLIESEWFLFHKHPGTQPPRWSARWGPVVRIARNWQRSILDDHVAGRSPKRLTRAVALGSGQFSLALAVAVVRWPRFRREFDRRAEVNAASGNHPVIPEAR